jgi:5'-methylthioadenosine phosphorylase/5'-methylthioinosine phosphorylase
MYPLAIIGGTGLTRLAEFQLDHRETVQTPWGAPSGDLHHGSLWGKPLIFLARHGDRHQYPPHRVNYRANLHALRQAGAARIIAVAAVGGIRADMYPGRLAIPDQLIDYTHGRAQTYFDENLEAVTHIDFTRPYTQSLRQELLQAGTQAGLDLINGGVYGCTQGPRLESIAEIRKLERDGCDLVGMTGMPEAALARELELEYACCAVVANWAAGKTAGEITMAEIEAHLLQGMADLSRLFKELLA